MSKGRFSQSWGLRASVSFSCLPSPSPLLLSVLHSPQLLRRQKAKKRLERAQNPTETLATQPSYKYSQRICAFISKFYLVISILYMQHTNETSKQKKTSKTAASKGRTIRKVMGGVGKKPKKNSCKGKCPKKKFMQGKMSEKKIHAQDGPHFDMKP